MTIESPGPILRFRGSDPDHARLCVTTTGGAAAGTRPLGTLAGTTFHARALRLPRAPDGSVDMPADRPAGVPDRLAIPRRGDALRIAFASCNGAEAEAAFDALPGGRTALWKDLARHHAERPFHLLALGGDQIYADAIWDLPALAAWRALPLGRRLRAPFTDAMASAVEAHYRDTYARAFAAPEVAALLASIPSIMIWDDHDIVDGWGSRPASWQAAPVPRGIHAAARRAFALVQAGLDPDAAPGGGTGHGGGGFGWSGDLGPARIAVPDLRSARTRRRVMDAAGHAHLRAAVSDHDRAHTLVVSSVPLVNADLSWVERAVRPLMRWADLFQDDLRDQWMSYAHRAEWARAMAPLYAAPGRVTVLSGEIHLGAQGTARRDGAAVEQLIASGIAHPPPPKVLARLHEAFSRRPWTREGSELRMHPVRPDGRRYLAERNWLELTLHPDGRRDAVLHAERSGILALDDPLARAS